MRDTKFGCLLLCVLTLSIISAGKSAAISTLTTQEMESVNGGCVFKFCIDDDPCTKKWCRDDQAYRDYCLTCTGIATNRRCIGEPSEPNVCNADPSIKGGCGFWVEGRCSFLKRRYCGKQWDPLPDDCSRATCSMPQ